MILLKKNCLIKNSSQKILCVIGFDWEMEILNTSATQCTYPSEYYFCIKLFFDQKKIIYAI